MRDSMTGIDNLQTTCPRPGIDISNWIFKTRRKSMFDNMAGARQAFVQIVNEIYMKNHMHKSILIARIVKRCSFRLQITDMEWIVKIFFNQPVPANSYDYVVYSDKERNDLVRSGKLAGFSPNNVRLPRVLVLI